MRPRPHAIDATPSTRKSPRHRHRIDRRSCYRRGDLGLEIDAPRAVALYERAVELGDAKAVVHLGLMLADGDGCPKDEARAAALFEALSKAKGPWAPWAFFSSPLLLV